MIMNKQSVNIPTNFTSFVKDAVKKLQSEYPHPNLGDAFAHWAVSLALPELDDDDIFELIVRASPSNNKGLSATFVDEQSGIQYLFEAKYGNEPQTFGSEIVRDLFQSFADLASDNLEADNEKTTIVAIELQNSIKHDFELRICLLLFGWLSLEAKEELELLLQNVKNGTYFIFDLDALYEQYVILSGIRPEISDIEITLPLHSNNRQVLNLTDVIPNAVVANVDLVEYSRRVREYIPRIFDANVRNPLRNKVNREMDITISDPDKRKYFWHYNNGLTILVTNIEETNDGLRITAPTIVNGCQTTAILSRAIEKLGSGANEISLPLLVRFIKIQSDEEESVVRLNISKYTNAQTPVIPPDFKSNDSEQETIAASFEMLTPKVFYERKRGQWDTLSKIEKDEFLHSVKMVDIAQRWYAFMFSPSKSIVSKGTLFQEEGTYKEVFTPPHSAEEYYISYLLFDQFNNFLKERKNNAELRPDKQTAVFIRLARARNLAVAHLTNLVGKLLIMKYGKFDYEIAYRILDKVQSGELFSALSSHFVTIVRQYDMTLPPNLPWLNALKRESAISDLETLLLQHIELYSSTVKINLLDYI